MKSAEASKLFGFASVQLIHQDGNHSEAITMAEIKDWWPKLAVNGYWVSDDLEWKTTQASKAWLISKSKVVEDHDDWAVFQKTTQ